MIKEPVCSSEAHYLISTQDFEVTYAFNIYALLRRRTSTTPKEDITGRRTLWSMTKEV